MASPINQIPGRGFGGGLVHCVFSSAVPVLPATVTPGIAAEAPVPLAYHADHQPAHGMRDAGARHARAGQELRRV